MIGLLPLLATADRGDIGGLSTDLHPQTGAPDVFVYDGHPGGAGIAERGFELFEEWVARTARAARRVPVRARLPVVRPVAQVRQPQRAARQGRRPGAAERLGPPMQRGTVAAPRAVKGNRCESGAVPPL